MEAKELRQLSIEELAGRVKQWQEELFRNRIKSQASEARDTSVLSKLRHNIARAYTVIAEKKSGSASAPQDKVSGDKK